MERIEPREFEKDILRGIAEELEQLRDPDDMCDAIAALMKETFFAVPEIEEDLFIAMAADIADRALGYIVTGLGIYTGTLAEFNGVTHEDVKKRYLVSKEKFKIENDGLDYDRMPDADRASMHLGICCSAIDDMMAWFVVTVTMADSPPELKQRRYREIAENPGHAPVDEFPELIGCVWAHHAWLELAMEHNVLLNGGAPEEAKRERAQVHADMVEALSPMPDEPAASSEAQPEAIIFHSKLH